MERLDYFKVRTSEHILYRRLAQRLSEFEFDVCVEFIEENDHLSHLEFEYAINRMFLSGANRIEKTKNWTIIQELLMVANFCKAQPRNGRK